MKQDVTEGELVSHSLLDWARRYIKAPANSLNSWSVFEKINNGAVKVGAENRMTFPRQSAESQQQASENPLASVMCCWYFTLTNGIEKSIKTKPTQGNLLPQGNLGLK